MRIQAAILKPQFKILTPDKAYRLANTTTAPF